jgi:hypothetical protein
MAPRGPRSSGAADARRQVLSPLDTEDGSSPVKVHQNWCPRGDPHVASAHQMSAHASTLAGRDGSSHPVGARRSRRVPARASSRCRAYRGRIHSGVPLINSRRLARVTPSGDQISHRASPKPRQALPSTSHGIVSEHRPTARSTPRHPYAHSPNQSRDLPDDATDSAASSTNTDTRPELHGRGFRHLHRRDIRCRATD